MFNLRTEQRRDFILFVRNLYVISLLVMMLLGLGLWIYDKYHLAPVNATLPIPTWITVLIFFVGSNIGVAVGLYDYLKKTRHRADDPDRFAVRQVRRLNFPSDFTAADLERALKSLGYVNINSNSSSGRLCVSAERHMAELKKRFPGKDVRPAQLLEAQIVSEGSKAEVELTMCPLNWWVLGDFTQTTYLSLTELVKALEK